MGNRLFFSSPNAKAAAEAADKLTRIEDVSNDLMDIAVKELTHVIDYQNSVDFDLNDDGHVKRAMMLKNNVTSTMSLLNKLEIFTMAKRGVLPKEFAKGKEPDTEMKMAASIVEKANLRLANDPKFR